MSNDISSAGPSPEFFRGQGFGPAFKRAFFATRPKFFTASILPVLVGTALGAKALAEAQASIPWSLAILALLATVLVHAASNVLNDVGDDISGADGAGEGRIYPFTGGSRFIQAGILTRAEMTRLGVGLVVASMVIGALLVQERGLAVLWMGVAGIALATLYSLPRIYLVARGLGEISIAIAFGVLPVCGAAWLLDGHFDLGRFLVGIPVGMWVALILVINEVPDLEGDAAAGKRTLVVRWGVRGTRALYIGLHVVSLAASVGAIALGELAAWYLLPALLVAAGGVKAALGIVDVAVKDETLAARRAQLQKCIELTLALQALGSLAVIAAIVFR